jgi:hypothetical protein
LESPAINTAGFSNINVAFLMKCAGEYVYDSVLNFAYLPDRGRILYSFDAGANWTTWVDELWNVPAKSFYGRTLPPAANNVNQFKIGLEWRNNASVVSLPSFIVDSMVIKGTSTCEIQTASHAANTEEAYIGPNETVHFYNAITKRIMATIENNSAFDLGCTKLEILRTGDSATQAWGLLAGDKISDKVYRVTTSNTDPSVSYTLKLYYSNAEINGWLAATGNNLADVKIVKTYGDLSAPAPASPAIFSSINARNNFGVTPHSVVSANFTGITGPATYGVMKPYGPSPCPATIFSYNSNVTGTTYQWQVNSGSGYTNISDDAVYANAQTAALQITSPSGNLFGNRYRCEVSVAGSLLYSQEFVLKSEMTWLGSVSNAWEEPLNWSCNSIPDANTDVIIENGTMFSPELNANTTIRSLTAAPASGLVLKTGVVLTVNH